MPTETSSTPRPRVLPALHRRLLLPLLLLVSLGALQLWLEDARRDDRLLLDLLDEQQQLVLSGEAALARAAGDTTIERLEKLRDIARLAEQRLQASLGDGAERLPGATALGGALTQQWRRLLLELEDLEALAGERLRAAEVSRRVDELGSALLLRGDELLLAMERAEEPADRMRAAGRQLVLAQRMAEAARQALRGEDDVLVMADRLGRDAVLFGEVNNALLDGDPRLGLARVQSDAAHDLLRVIGDHYRDLAGMVEGVMQGSVALHGLRDAPRAAALAATRITATLDEARAARLALRAERAPAWLLRDVLAMLCVVSMLGVALLLMRERSLRSRELLANLEALRDADDRRLALESTAAALRVAREGSADAMQSTLAAVREGNLAARCELDTGVWKDTGTEALDAERNTVAALNRTLDTLAERLAEARRTSRDVARAVDAAREGARQSRDLSDEQVNALAETRPARDAEGPRLDDHAAVAGELARNARERASQGRAAADLVEETRTRGEAVRDQLATALRLAAHLSDRGRELRELVRLLDDLADEGRILALNATIHASLARGGEPAGDALSQAVQRLADGVAVVERRGGALADILERTGEECVEGLRRAASGLGGTLQLCALGAERSLEAAAELQRHAEHAGGLAANGATLAANASRRQAALSRVEQLTVVVQQSAADSDRQIERARELVELLSAHLAALRLPAHEDANVVDLRDFLKR